MPQSTRRTPPQPDSAASALAWLEWAHASAHPRGCVCHGCLRARGLLEGRLMGTPAEEPIADASGTAPEQNPVARSTRVVADDRVSAPASESAPGAAAIARDPGRLEADRGARRKDQRS